MTERFLKKVSIPNGESGDFRIDHFTIDQGEAFRTLIAYDGRACLPGEYTRLRHAKRGCIMSDTPAEQLDHLEPVKRARGSCLINGLGIGMVLHNILLKPDVTDITVVEMEEDVIKLVAPTYLTDPRVTIVHANAFEFSPPAGKRYGMVWHDIWDTIGSENLPDMKRLRNKYRGRCNWQGFWCYKMCIDEERDERNSRELDKLFSALRAPAKNLFDELSGSLDGFEI